MLKLQEGNTHHGWMRYSAEVTNNGRINREYLYVNRSQRYVQQTLKKFVLAITKKKQ